MKLRVQTAMVGVATAMLFGCSNPPVEDGPGTGGTTAATGTAGTSAPTGTAGTSASTGAAGTSAPTGTAGTSASGAAGTSATGTAGTAAASAGTGGGAAGTGGGAAGTTGAAGTGGGAAGTGGGAAACPTGVKGHCNAETGAKDKYPGYTLALAEEFDVALDLDKDPIWTWSDGGPPEGQARFAKENITFANGTMILTAQAVNVPQSASYAEPAKNQTTGNAHACAVKSGEFRTRHNNYRYGRYEARYKAPVENVGKAGDGNYLSTLFIFRTPKWGEWNEIDIELEANIKGKVAYNMVNAIGATGYPGGDAGSMVPPGATGFNIQQFHTYAFEWNEAKVTWYVDGVKLRDNGANPPIPKNSAKIMMNLWIFGSNGAFGEPNNNTYPFTATYEWFRFYKANVEPTYPVDEPRTGLPAGDVDFSRNNIAETTYPNFPML